MCVIVWHKVGNSISYTVTGAYPAGRMNCYQPGYGDPPLCFYLHPALTLP